MARPDGNKQALRTHSDIMPQTPNNIAMPSSCQPARRIGAAWTEQICRRNVGGRRSSAGFARVSSRWLAMVHENDIAAEGK